MNITIRSAEFMQELKLLAKISATKATLPALKYVLMHATDDAVELLVTDLELSMRTVCAATVHGTGSVTLPTKKLLELLEYVVADEITLEVGNDIVKVHAGTFKSRLQTIPVKEFPPIPVVGDGEIATVAASSLRTLVERTRYAIDDKAQKFVLNGALMSLNTNVIALVSTDGKRLSLATAIRPDGPNLSVVVPSKTLDLLPSMSEVGDVEILQTDRNIFFINGTRTLISRKIDEAYPKYEKIIPRGNDKQATINRLFFAAALRRMNVIADDTASVVFDLALGTLNLSSRSKDGDADESFPVDYEGEPVKVCLSGRHVLEFLDVATEGSIVMHVKDATTQVLLTDGSDFLNVLLTRKVS